MIGTVVRLREDRGFGFIHQDGTDERNGVFFHCRDLSSDLQFDETLLERRVRFEATNGEKGLKAINVRPL